MEDLEIEFKVDQMEIMVEPQKTMSKYKTIIYWNKAQYSQIDIATNNFEIKLNII